MSISTGKIPNSNGNIYEVINNESLISRKCESEYVNMNEMIKHIEVTKNYEMIPINMRKESNYIYLGNPAKETIQWYFSHIKE